MRIEQLRVDLRISLVKDFAEASTHQVGVRAEWLPRDHLEAQRVQIESLYAKRIRNDHA